MTRDPRRQEDPAAPRTDAPEHPVDPADAAFLDPSAVPRPRPEPPETEGSDTRPPGYGDYEGERADAEDDPPAA
jgi:hypothetical protein